MEDFKEFKAYLIDGDAYVVEEGTTMSDPETGLEFDRITVNIEKDLLKFLVTDCGLLDEIGVSASIWSN
jgi:hypothetical protein